jgi:hypothetical protein
VCDLKVIFRFIREHYYGEKGRPAKFVFDETGKPIVGLSLDKNNGSFYATYSKPRQYFGSDYARAVFEYYRYPRIFTIL